MKKPSHQALATPRKSLLTKIEPADYNPGSCNELFALAALLKEALRIEQDLTGRMFQHPREKSLLRQHKEYQQLVEQLTWELGEAVTRYLATTKASEND